MGYKRFLCREFNFLTGDGTRELRMRNEKLSVEDVIGDISFSSSRCIRKSRFVAYNCSLLYMKLCGNIT